jgi:hypothetical protein
MQQKDENNSYLFNLDHNKVVVVTGKAPAQHHLVICQSSFLQLLQACCVLLQET